MQDQPHIGPPAFVGPNAAPGNPNSIPVENAIGSAFVRLLAETRGHAQRDPSSESNAIRCFVNDVRRRKAKPHGTYDGLVDIAATAAARILVYGVDCHDESRKDPASLTIYRKMRWLVKSSSSGPAPSFDQHVPATNGVSDDDGAMEFEAIERQELLNEAYDSGYSVGFEAGIRAQAAQDRQRSAETSYAEGFAAGQRAELDRVQIYVAEVSRRTGHGMEILGLVPEPESQWPQPPQQGEAVPSAPGSIPPGYLEWDSQPLKTHTPPDHSNSTHKPSQRDMLSSSIDSSQKVSNAIAQPSQLGPAPEATMQARPEFRPQNDGDARHMVVTCVFCGRGVTANSLLRHKKRRHPAELAAVGVELQYYPCWWPGCGMLPDNLVSNQLTTHLQRKHNYTPPGDPNAFTENIKYYTRMLKDMVIGIISESAQELNAVKERIKSLEAQLRAKHPSYVSRHGLPNLNYLYETREPVLDLLLIDKALLPLAVQELRQLKRARGMRSQIRHDDGTWWEVADDLEAALNPSGALAQAVAALPPPGDGPTVHMSPGTLVEGPNMNDPNWKPRYVPLFRPNWGKPTSQDEHSDGVILPPNTAIRRTNFEIVIPSFSRHASTAQEQVEDEEEQEGFQRLMAEIEQRVVDDNSEPDEWSDNYDGTAGVHKVEEIEGDDTHYDAVPSTKSSSQPKKRPGPPLPIPGNNKRRKSSQVSKRRDSDLG